MKTMFFKMYMYQIGGSMKKKILYVIGIGMIFVIACCFFVSNREKEYILHGSFQNLENSFEDISFDNKTKQYFYYHIDKNDATVEEEGKYESVQSNEYHILDGNLKDTRVIVSKDSIELLSTSNKRTFKKINTLPVVRK